jgi:L-ascorbate metabolism protein UlaG (beta-lactamase superfamily)
VARNPYYSGPVSDHFDGLRFYAPGGSRDKSLADLLRMLRNARNERAPWPAARPTLPCPPPPARVEGLRVTLIGHSTFLIQTEGVNLLTDPVWADRAGPFGLLGPKRVTAPALRIEDLPPLDAILLSHNHYDHMDLATLSQLAKARPCPVLTPLGNDTILTRHDPRIDARAFDWGETREAGGLQVTLAPALHWSARGRGDRRMALWGSFMIGAAAGPIYYAGDTGYGDGSLFPGIAERFGRPRLALLPIGAYAPRWFMRDQHCDPDEAVAIFLGLGAERAIACHWGTFRLTDEPYDEPPQRLTQALARAGVAAERFVAPGAGGVLEFG